MSDTVDRVERLHRELLMARRPEEHPALASSMFDGARAVPAGAAARPSL